jgi:hypothetical protein
MKRLLYLLLFLPSLLWGQNEAINLDSDTITYSGSLANSAIQVGKVYVTANDTVDGDPSDLAASAVSDVAMSLTWTDNSTNEDGFQILRSTNGTDYTVIDSAAADAEAYSAISLTSNTRYYFKVRGYNTSDLSELSSADDDYTAFKIPLAATGTGAGVATLKMTCTTTNIIATLDGNGKFYSDADGTADESASWTITAGELRTIYLKVTSGNSSLLVFAKGNLTQFGTGASSGWVASANAPTISMALAALPSSVIEFHVGGNNTISGTISQITTDMSYFLCYGSNTISGDLGDLPIGLIYFYCLGSNTISGDLNDLSSGIIRLDIRGSNTIADYTSGHIFSDLFTTFTFIPTGVGGLSATEIDNLLIDMNTSWTTTRTATITLTGTNAARTSASDAAVTALKAKGRTIVTNP